MPIRKTSFYENGFYHVYNRGVEKREIFLDEKDYNSFLGILKSYLEPIVKRDKTILQGRALERIRKHTLATELSLISFCLMPNHFHFLIQQRTSVAITNLLRRVLTAYSMYFNLRYERVGSLFQGRFKAKEITNDEYLLHLTRYIHRNPVKAKMVKVQNLANFKWSSYPNYLGLVESSWVKPKAILDYFASVDSKKDYQGFVEFESEGALPEGLLLD
jgi:putative transposase